MTDTKTGAQWIARRTLAWGDRQVVVQIGVPYEDSNLGEWKCDCTVSLDGEHQVFTVPGVDSIAALTHALVIARKKVDARFPGASWLGRPHSGLAMWIPVALVPAQHQQELEAIMWKEIYRRMEEDIAKRSAGK